MKECLEKFAASKGRYYDKAVMIIILSHGGNGCVAGSDYYGNTINLNEVFSYFTDEACPGLTGKPKVFMIDACRNESNIGACGEFMRAYWGMFTNVSRALQNVLSKFVYH